MADSSISDLVLSSTPAPGVRLLRLNRPEKRNALSQSLISSLLSELRLASGDTSIFSIILTGNGPFFCAGADLNDIAALDEAGARASRYLQDLCAGFASVKKPIIAAVNGPALGGGFEISLMRRFHRGQSIGGLLAAPKTCLTRPWKISADRFQSDLIISAQPAYFVLPETKIGLIPGAGGTQRLTAAIGKYRAMRSILLAQPMSAQEAMAAGLVTDVVGPDTLIQRCVEIASTFTAENRQTIAFAKEAICRADDLCRDDRFERDLYYTAFGTDEKKCGVDNFLAARKKKA
ncbi:putative enoyl-CoA hydratase, mitochondrial [Beauveria bassiana]|uniref:Enoyl-CoA hydratase/isomerase family protein n=1 Tax=Beauveria bassiana (strain ARSEF 2860) TaxID=655819 RepID=J4W6T2_BEAB2|nr:enoyl-CoA hydratase/isomerase family protein [Beauveria bassiana ARSEF 2860]EJP66005.1 enoyl-CoA hydratase/isomerase family protein [Beauveria bassiana ARSEF 2860]KAH8711559.1 putative enoyl-CoA hydratase, mitochondrial [Beauveria bassiana]